MELPTYTNIWRIEKRLYKLYDFRLPMPLPVGQIAVFAAITVPYVVILKLLGLPFSHTLLWLYILPPGVLAWLVTRPVLEGKRLPELVHSQLRYLGEPRTWCRMAPLAEEDEIMVVARVWRRVRPEIATFSVPDASAVPVSEITVAEVAVAGVTEAEAGVTEIEAAAAGIPEAETPALAAPRERARRACGAALAGGPDRGLARRAGPGGAGGPGAARAGGTGPGGPARCGGATSPGRGSARAAPAPAAREARLRVRARACPVRPARRVPAPGVGEAPRTDQPRRGLPAPAAPETSGADQARAVSVPDVSGRPGPEQAASAVPGPPAAEVHGPPARAAAGPPPQTRQARPQRQRPERPRSDGDRDRQ